MVFLNKLSITATFGCAVSTYNHKLSGVYYYQSSENQFIFSNDTENLSSTFFGYTDWLNAPRPELEVSINDLLNMVNNPVSGGQPFLINTDTTDLGFKGTSWGIPIRLSIHYQLEDFRIGGGFTYEKQFVSALNPTAYINRVMPYQPNFKTVSHIRLYGLIGYKIYEYWAYDFVAELQTGKTRAGKPFDKAAINENLYMNFGVSIENNRSEYFRVVIKPSIDFKRYTVDLPDGSSVLHKNPAFLIQTGLSINIPDIPRSPMKNDHIQLKHVYTDPKTGRLMEVRGQPIWRKQNPKIGENHHKVRRPKRNNKR